MSAAEAFVRDSRYVQGVLLVLLAGTLWSLAGIVIRNMDAASDWQIVFYRSAGMVPVVFLAIWLRHRGRMGRAFGEVGWTGVLGALFLATAFVGMILAFVHTTVANALFIFACGPIVAAVLGRMILKEAVAGRTWLAIAVAFVGVGVIVADGFAGGGLFGNLLSLMAALGFAAYTIALRLRRDADMFVAVFLAGLFSMAFAALMADGLAVGPKDLMLSLFLGLVQMAAGQMVYALGSRRVPAAELVLLSQIEVVLGPIWVWLGVGETPSALTLTGGSIVMAAIALRAASGVRRRPPPVGVVCDSP